MRVAVSVVIPVKDDGTELDRCLKALAAQSRIADEIIVVDNGSSDRSATVALSAGATLVRCDEPGIPAAAAAGYDRATGDLILRLDADCVPAESWIQDICNRFAQRPEVSAFTGRAHFIDGPTSLRPILAAAYLLAYATATVPALGHLPLFGSNLAMRREVWKDVQSTVHRDDPDLHDDLDLAYHLGEGNQIRYFHGSSMGISMRPFRNPAALRQRVYRGFRTVAVHWPHDFPPARWWRLVLRPRRALIEPARQRQKHAATSADGTLTSADGGGATRIAAAAG